MAARAATTRHIWPVLFWCLASPVSANDAVTLWASRTEKGMVAAAAGQVDEAVTLLRAALVAAQDLGEDDLRLATAKSNLALIRLRKDDVAGAGPLLKEALDMRRRILGGGHPRVADSLIDLAVYYQAAGKGNEAEITLGKALSVRETLFGPADERSLEVLDRLRDLAMANGRLDEAIRIGLRALASSPRNDDKFNEKWRLPLAVQLSDSARWSEAEQVLRDIIQVSDTPPLRINLSNVLAAQGKTADAVGILKDTLEERLAAASILARPQPEQARALMEVIGPELAQMPALAARYDLTMAQIEYSSGQADSALVTADRLLARFLKSDTIDQRLLSDALFLRASIFRTQEKFDLAIEDLRLDLELEYSNTPAIRRPTLEALAETQVAAGLLDAAKATRERIAALKR